MSYIIVLKNGGDWMPHFRLLSQYAPCYCLAFGLIYYYRIFPTVTLTTVAALSLLLTIKDADLLQTVTIDIRTEPEDGIFSESAERLKPILRQDDLVSAEAAGLLPYRLLSTRIHDPVGLMDVHIARYGMPSIPYGKTDIPYTFGVVKPTFMIWHWAGHVFSAPRSLREQYQAFCFSDCDDHDSAKILLVRNDRMGDDVTKAFSRWNSWPYFP